MKLFTSTLVLLMLSLAPDDAFAAKGDVKVLKVKDEVMKPIIQLFDAMREHDGEKLKAQFTQTAMLQRVGKDNQVTDASIAKFAASISQAKVYLDEQLFNVSFNISGNLASVWTPFAFYIDGKLSHCGVNSFQLVKRNIKGDNKENSRNESDWKIHYLVDNAYTGDCQGFIARHKSE